MTVYTEVQEQFSSQTQMSWKPRVTQHKQYHHQQGTVPVGLNWVSQEGWTTANPINCPVMTRHR